MWLAEACGPFDLMESGRLLLWQVFLECGGQFAHGVFDRVHQWEEVGEFVGCPVVGVDFELQGDLGDSRYGFVGDGIGILDGDGKQGFGCALNLWG